MLMLLEALRLVTAKASPVASRCAEGLNPMTDCERRGSVGEEVLCS